MLEEIRSAVQMRLLVILVSVLTIALLLLGLAVISCGLRVPGWAASLRLMRMVVGTDCLVVRLVVIVLRCKLLLLSGMRVSVA